MDGGVGRCVAGQHGSRYVEHGLDIGEANQAEADVFAALRAGLRFLPMQFGGGLNQVLGDVFGVGAVERQPVGAAARRGFCQFGGALSGELLV